MGYFIYYLLFQQQATTPAPTPTTELPTGSLPQAGAGQPATSTQTQPGQLPTTNLLPPVTLPNEPTTINTIEKNHLINDSLTQNVSGGGTSGSARYYNAADGRFYRVNADGSVTALSNKQFFNVKDVSWGNETDRAILQFPDGSNVYYDFQTQSQVQLPQHWQSFDFSPTDDKIIGESIGLDSSNRFLFVSNPNGGEAKAIANLGDNADLVQPSWSPNNQVVAFSQTGQPSSNGQTIIPIGQNQENFKALNVPGYNFLPNWSPSGKQILYSVRMPQDGNNPVLWISSGEVTSMGANRRNLKLNTWADKCAWAGDSDLYCGVPQNLPLDAGLQREATTEIPDDLYHIDLNSGAAIKINPPDQIIPIKNPVVSADKTKFIYTDASSGKLYSFDLK